MGVKIAIYSLVTLGLARLIWALREASPAYAMTVLAGIGIATLLVVLAAVFAMMMQRRRLVARARARYRKRPRSLDSILKYRT